MTTLTEAISEDICINHVRAMREVYVPEEDLHCRNCDGLFYDCDKYKSVKNTGIRFKDLRLYRGVAQ